MKQEIKIDTKRTIQNVKRELAFLAHNIWMLQEPQNIVEDSYDLMEFLPYSKSVIEVQHNPTYATTSRVIEAMEQRKRLLEKQFQIRQETIGKVQILLSAIAFLPEKERFCVEERYVKHATLQQIATQLHSSLSTTSRILDKAYLHLAQLLNLEVEK